MIKKTRKDRSPRITKPKVSLPKNHRFSYKEIEMLKNFISSQGMILSRSKTGLTQKQQRQLALEIKRARHLALLPFVQGV